MTTMLHKHCPICEKYYVPFLALADPDFNENYSHWQEGGPLIQKVWPRATAIQREQLQTGICSNECWDKVFSDDETLPGMDE